MSLARLTRHPHVKKLSDAFASFRDARIFLVGGCVRDALLNRSVKDLDVVIAGMPVAELERTLASLGTVDTVGGRFAVLKVRLNDGSVIDVALPRTDASFGTGRYRDVEVRADPRLSIEEDLKRRDFTMNALAFNVRTQELVDPHSGTQDIKRRIIRSVGDPKERFQEDATRILRAIRFSVVLGFSIEKRTALAMQKKLPLLADESVTPREVVAKELVRAFTAHPVAAFDLLEQHGIFRALIPELDALHDCKQPIEYHAEGDAWMHERLALVALMDPSFRRLFKTTPTSQLVIAALLHDLGKPLTKQAPEHDGVDRVRFDGHQRVGAEMAMAICKRLRLSSAGIDCGLLAWLIEHHMDILNVDEMKPTTLERTYLAPGRGDLLIQLSWADGKASLSQKEVKVKKQLSDPKRVPRLLRRLSTIKTRGYAGAEPKMLLSGSEIMKTLSVGSGPTIGIYREQLREAQLNGTVSSHDEAIKFIEDLHAKRTQR